MSELEQPNVTADLLERARRGDRRGLDQLVLRFEPQLRRYLSRRLAAGMSVDDLFQDISMEAHRWLPSFSYREAGSYLAWLYTIARRCVAREYESRHRELPTLRLATPQRGATTQNLMASLAAPDTSPADRVARAQVFELLSEALSELADKRRTAIVLRYFEQHDNPEAAALMEMTPQAFRTCLSRARRQLADVLDYALG